MVIGENDRDGEGLRITGESDLCLIGDKDNLGERLRIGDRRLRIGDSLGRLRVGEECILVRDRVLIGIGGEEHLLVCGGDV